MPGRERVTFQTEKAGTLIVERDGEDLVLDFPARPALPCPMSDAVVAALGKRPAALLAARDYLAVYERTDEPEVTGVILTRNGRIRLPERLKRIMRKLAGSDEPHDGQRLAGYRAYEKMMTRRAARKPRAAPPRLPPRPPPAPDGGEEIPF